MTWVFLAGLLILATLFGALGAIFLKMGSKKFDLSFVGIFKNTKFITGGVLYVVGLGLYIYLLKFLPLSLAYPLSTLTYVWVIILSKYYLRENVNKWRISGLACIILGISTLALV